MESVVLIDVGLLQFIVNIFLPWVVALVTRRFSDERIKSGVMTVAAIITSALQEVIGNDGAFSVAAFIGNFLTAIISAFVFHQYIWKPIGVTGDQGFIMKAVPGGIGRVVTK